MQIEPRPRVLPGHRLPHHHHPRIPEEQDVEAGDQEVVGVVAGDSKSSPARGGAPEGRRGPASPPGAALAERWDPSVSPLRACHLPVPGRTFVRPAQRGKRPQRGGEPGVEDVGCLAKMANSLIRIASDHLLSLLSNGQVSLNELRPTCDAMVHSNIRLAATCASIVTSATKITVVSKIQVKSSSVCRIA